VILVDANLLIYAVNRDLPQHDAARTWWEVTLSGSESIGIPWISLLAFLRVCTNRRVFDTPLPPDAAIRYVDEWLRQPPVKPVSPGTGHWSILADLLTRSGMAGNLTTDAHIAALAMEHGYTVYSADNDFKRFAGLRHVNPLAR
jgi:toxin-antitoxin system PIN domain toxin